MDHRAGHGRVCLLLDRAPAVGGEEGGVRRWHFLATATALAIVGGAIMPGDGFRDWLAMLLAYMSGIVIGIMVARDL